MTIFSVYTAVYISLFIITATTADWIFGKIPLVFVGLVMLPAAFFLCRQWVVEQGRPLKSKMSGISLLCFLLLLLYFLIPAAWRFFPLSMAWDGPNHLGLAGYLAERASHREFFDQQFTLLYGTAIWSYPWGFHAFVAALSRATGIHVAHLIYGISLMGFSLAISCIVDWGREHGMSGLSLLMTVGFIVMFAVGGYTIVLNNFWSQAFSTFLCVAIFSFLSLSNLSINIPLLGILIGGLVLTYPLYFISIAPGLVAYGAVKSRQTLLRILVAIAVGGAFSAPGMLPTLSENWMRLYKSGPVLWGNFVYLSDWLLFSLYAVSVPACIFLLRKFKHNELWIPLLSITAIVPLFVVGATPYWFWKWNMLNMLLLIPSFSFVVDILLIRPILKTSLPRFLKAGGILLIVLVLTKAYSPVMSSVWKLKPAIQPADMEMARWLSENHGNRHVFFHCRLMKMVWMDALFVNPPVLRNINIVKMINGKYVGPSDAVTFSGFFLSSSSPGDIMAVQDRTFPIDEQRFNYLIRFGPWEVFQRR